MAIERRPWIDALLALAMANPAVAKWLSSQPGGLFVNMVTGRASNAEMDRFEEDIAASNEESARIIREEIGIGGPTVRIREEANMSPAARAQIQSRIDAGTAPESWLDQFTEKIPQAELPPTIVAGAFELEEKAAEWAEQDFDPESAAARYGRAFGPTYQIDPNAPPGYRAALESLEATYGDLGTALSKLPPDVAAQYGAYVTTEPGITGELKALPGEVTAATERVQGMYGDVGTEFEAGRADVMGQYGTLREELEAGGTELMGDYGELLGTARGLVASLGEAERQDINRRWTETGTEAQMGLAARGVGGGTISSSLASGIERERGTALLNLQEQTTRQQLGVEETFGLPGLSAQERLLGAGINVGAQQAGAAERFVGGRVNLGTARAGALERGGQLYAQTAAGTLAARTGIAAGEVGEYDWAAMNRLNNLYRFGQIPIDTRKWAASEALRWQGPKTLVMPGQNYPPNVYPYGGENW